LLKVYNRHKYKTIFSSNHPKKIILYNAAETNEAAAQGHGGGD
jgi:hypothetical protein